jgi:hypothetical protein
MLELFFGALADELEIEAMSLGALTLEREDLARAIEPDTCFYIQNESLVRNKTVAIVNGSKKHNSVGAGSPTIIAQSPQSRKPAPAPPSIPIYLF